MKMKIEHYFETRNSFFAALREEGRRECEFEKFLADAEVIFSEGYVDDGEIDRRGFSLVVQKIEDSIKARIRQLEKEGNHRTATLLVTLLTAYQAEVLDCCFLHFGPITVTGDEVSFSSFPPANSDGARKSDSVRKTGRPAVRRTGRPPTLPIGLFDLRRLGKGKA